MNRSRKNVPIDELQTCLAVAGALVSAGLLPKQWQKSIGVTSCLLWLATQV